MEQSIFGNTYAGVVSPNVFHHHPYPTRYHGMNLTVPRFPTPFVENPYAVPSFMGVDEDASFGTSVISAGFWGGAMGAIAGAVVGKLAYGQTGKYAAIGAGAGAALTGALAIALDYSWSSSAAKAKAPAATNGLGSSCGCTGMRKAGGTAADSSSLGRY